MADYTYEGVEMAPASVKVASLGHWLGAAASIALIVGVGVWGYRVMARDVTGVPIVQAMGGPMRVAPEDPGGGLADHQGLAVNAVAGEGGAAASADRVVLAPVSARLAAEDVATGDLVAIPNNPIMPLQASLRDKAEAMELSAGDDLIQALANDIAKDIAPLSPLAPLTDITDASAAAPTAPVVETPRRVSAPKFTSGLVRSLRPRVRPAGLQTASLGAQPVVSTAQITKEIDPASLAAGTRLVQIGAYDSAETARKEWTRFETRFGDYMEGKDRVIQRANSGGKTFFRLRVHCFADVADSNRFCTAFKAQNVDCIPVASR
jgi:hypothetical protein